MISQQMCQIATMHYASLETDLAADLSRDLLTGRHGNLVTCATVPSEHATPHSYFLDAAATEFLRKMPGLNTGIDLEAQAVRTFYSCEAACYKTNQRVKRWLAWFDDGFVGSPADLALYQTIHLVRDEIRRILGPVPRTLVPKFGPGSTFHDRGVRITIPDKMSASPSLTTNAEWTSLFIYPTAWGRSLLANGKGSAPRRVKGNRFTTVPKDSSKDRGIAIEPSGNLCMQLAIAVYIRKSLLLGAAIDLNHGQERHRRHAKRASMDKSLATIDLSNASDTVSRDLVKLLLPKMWFQVLNSLRSPYTFIGGRWVRLEKFSSMGNGFTFELETLLFLAITRVSASLEGQDTGMCSAYGDDILVPTAACKTTLGLLEAFGFTANMKKTFSEGNFRESCGGDFFSGVAVRPLYVKKDPETPSDWISLANAYRRIFFCARTGWYLPKMAQVWERMLGFIPTHIRRLRGPEILGDIVIHDHEHLWNLRYVDGCRQILCWEPVSRKRSLNNYAPSVQLASLLYGVPSTGAGVRGGVHGYRKKWKAYP